MHKHKVWTHVSTCTPTLSGKDLLFPHTQSLLAHS